MEAGRLLFNIWPIWYDPVGMTTSDDRNFDCAWRQEAKRLGNFQPHPSPMVRQTK